LKAPFVKPDVLRWDFEERDHLGDWDVAMSHGLRISFKPEDSESEGPVGPFWKQPAILKFPHGRPDEGKNVFTPHPKNPPLKYCDQ
jgi:hypothetical protein